MKKSKFTEEQIAFALKQAETGKTIEEICRKMSISQATFYNWHKGATGWAFRACVGSGNLRNRKLKLLVADLSLDKAMLQDVLVRKL